jgi:hypothetical protein
MHMALTVRLSEENIMQTIKVVALAALCSASAAFAQAPANPPSKEMAQDKTAEKGKQDPYAVQGSGPPTFNMLKGHEKGHLTLEEAEPNSWLAGNFAKCDADKDNKLTEKEFNACRAVK